MAGADHRLAVELLDPELGQAAGRDRVGERPHGGGQLGVAQLAKAKDAATAALDVDERLAVAEQDVGAGGAGGTPPRRGFRPGQRRAEGVGGVGCGQDLEGAVGFGQRAQTLDRAGEGELGTAQALDEVAAAGGAE